jgi:hypothetical protein
MVLDMSATASAREINQVIDQGGGMSTFSGFNEKSSLSVPNNFLCRTATECDHRCSRSHRLNRHQAEGFIPFDREEEAT